MWIKFRHSNLCTMLSYNLKYSLRTHPITLDIFPAKRTYNVSITCTYFPCLCSIFTFYILLVLEYYINKWFELIAGIEISSSSPIYFRNLKISCIECFSRCPNFHKPLVELEQLCYIKHVITHPSSEFAKSGKMRVWEKQISKR